MNCDIFIITSSNERLTTSHLMSRVRQATNLFGVSFICLDGYFLLYVIGGRHLPDYRGRNRCNNLLAIDKLTSSSSSV